VVVLKEVFVRQERCLGCKSCELACAVAHSRSGNLFASLGESQSPRKRIYADYWQGSNFIINCRHCEEPLCARVCPTHAICKDSASGKVVQAYERCIGCGMCQLACPFGVISRYLESKKTVKCDGCPDRETPACVVACPTRALLYVDSEELMQGKRQVVAQQLLNQGSAI